VGRQPLLSNRQLPQFKKLLIQYAGQPQSAILQRVKEKFHVTMKPRTYRKYAVLVGAPYVRIPSRPPLKDTTRKKQLSFARKYRNLRGLFDMWWPTRSPSSCIQRLPSNVFQEDLA